MAYPWDDELTPPPLPEPMWLPPPPQVPESAFLTPDIGTPEMPNILPAFEAPPQHPAYDPNFLERLGLAFQNLPPMNPGGMAPGGALLAGLMQGYGASKGGQTQRNIAGREQENQRLTEAARQMAQKRWREANLAIQQARLKADNVMRQKRAEEQAERDRITNEWREKDYNLRRETLEFNKNKPSEGEPDYETIARGIIDYTIPPTQLISGRGTKQGMKLIATVKRLNPKFNLTDAALRYSSIQRQVLSLNSTQMTNLQQRIATAEPTAESIRTMNEELRSLLPRSAITKLNQVGLAVAVNGAFGPEVARVASRLQSQVSILRTELPTILNGGYAPLEENIRQANKMIDPAWGPDRIDAGIDLVHQDIGYRKSAMGTTQPTLPWGIGPGYGGFGQGNQPPPQGPTQADMDYVRGLGIKP